MTQGRRTTSKLAGAKNILTTIPFAGFYESFHSQLLDDEVEQLTQDDHGDQYELHEIDEDGDPVTYRPGDDVRQQVNWAALHAAYAKLYAEQFGYYFKGETGIDLKLVFDELSSPREYNFTTDRIFVTIAERTVKALWRAADKAKLDELIHDRFTSRSGFNSYYDNSLAGWGKLVEWDHNQVATLIESVFAQYVDVGECRWECDMVEDFSGNGLLANIVDEALTPEGQALVKRVYDAREREEYVRSHQLTLPLAKGGQG